jgi:hypothetical protein
MALESVASGLDALRSLSEEIEKFSTPHNQDDMYPVDAAKEFFHMFFKMVIIPFNTALYTHTATLYKGPKFNMGNFKLESTKPRAAYVEDLTELRTALRTDLEVSGLVDLIKKECTSILTDICEHLGLKGADIKDAVYKMSLARARRASDDMDRLWTVSQMLDIIKKERKHHGWPQP